MALDKTGQAQPISDPAPNVPFSTAFRNEMHKEESPKDDYKAINTGSGALGRYQLTDDALKDAGLKDRKTGQWTGKYGIHSAADFLNNPRAQELAAADYHEANIRHLTANGAMNRTGQTYQGIKAPITITDAGLVAAAHRYGAKTVGEYLDHVFAHKGISDQNTFPSGKEKAYLAIETRLRKFQNIPLRP